jgi:hypothetical protein
MIDRLRCGNAVSILPDWIARVHIAVEHRKVTARDVYADTMPLIGTFLSIRIELCILNLPTVGLIR